MVAQPQYKEKSSKSEKINNTYANNKYLESGELHITTQFPSQNNLPVNLNEKTCV